MAPTSKPVLGGWRFWAMFPGLCFAILLVGLDTSIISTALPTITADLHSGELYVWTVNGYFLTTAAVQPITGQLADIFGRKLVILLSIVLFALGSGLCGGASSIEMLIAARLIQGIGGGGLFVIVDIIVADLVPLRDRQKYMSLIMGTFAMGTFVGPILGGVIVGNIYWGWIFYINLPVSGFALILVILFLKVKHTREGTITGSLKRVDLLGNLLLTASVVAILIPLTWGGTLYEWSSWHILLPLFLGVAGLVAFTFHQKYMAQEPTMPLRVYSNSTSFLSYVLTFLHGIEMAWLSFFLPVYFQVILEASPLRSGVNLLASVIPLMPAGIAGGLTIAMTGRYKPTLILGYALMSIGVGCISTLTASSSTAKWVTFQIITGAGAGLALTSTLPSVQAPLPESDVAVATASWGFVRSFGQIWGAAIPAAIFNSRIDSLLYRISDQSARLVMARGGAYEHATKAFITSFNANSALKQEIIEVYTAAMKEVWQILIAFTVVAVPLAVFIREIPLRKELLTQFGIQGDEDDKKAKGKKVVTDEGTAMSTDGNGSVAATGRQQEGVELDVAPKTRHVLAAEGPDT